MPGYAFGSKQRLYEAVLARAFAAGPRDLVAQLATQPPSGDPKQLLRSVIEGYIDFLVDRPRYVRLMERAALDGSSRFGQSQAHLEALNEALGGADSLLASGAFADVDPRHLFVDVVALCLFPLAHRQTLLGPPWLRRRRPGVHRRSQGPRGRSGAPRPARAGQQWPMISMATVGR